MSLRTHFETTGNWLFRHRSFLPLLTLPLIVAPLFSFSYLGHNHLLEELWNAFALLISFTGLAIRVAAVGYAPKGTSGRNTRQQVATTLNTTGLYSLMRHPLYLGNYVAVFGVAVFFHQWWLLLLITCLFALYYERIMFAEEAFLQKKFGASFDAWAAITPAVIPRLRNWVRPALPFCWRTVLRREYTGFLLVTLAFFLLEVLGDSIVERQLRIDWPWCVLLAVGLIVYLALRTLKKNSSVLDMPGR